MHLVPFEFTKPKDDSAFEDMCANVYGEVFRDPLPSINGRRGQAQSGVDVFVESPSGRFGVQCKRYADGALKFKHIEEEVAKADKKGARIVRLIVATTAVSDARLIEKVHELSDVRRASGKFPVDVQFWEDICRHIESRPKLLNDYAPNAPGGAFYRQEERGRELLEAVQQVGSQVGELAAALPSARPESVNKLVSNQLDHINELLKSNRYDDAREALKRLGADLAALDNHQQARWYLQRGICTWHQDSGEAAAPDFLLAAELYPNDEKMAAAKVRGLFLSGKPEQAVQEGHSARQRYPNSVHVWLAHANARMVAGDSLGPEDIPNEFKESADVLQLVAWARRGAEDYSAAIHVSQQALALPEAGFYVRLAAVGIAVQAGLVDPVAGMHGMLPENVKAAISASTTAFEPWAEEVFSVQAVRNVEEAVTLLMYGYKLLGRPERALALSDEARERGVSSPRLLRAHIDTLRDLGRRRDTLDVARARLHELDDEGLVLTAEAAANEGDADLLQTVEDLFRSRHPDLGELRDTFTALRWVATWKRPESDKQAVLTEIRSGKLHETSSLQLLLGGARVLSEAAGDDTDEVTAAAARVTQIVSVCAAAVDRIAAADLLFELGEHEKAAPYYASLVRPGVLSHLHTRLLECYVRSGSMRKARALLDALPKDWPANDRARSLAIELGQDAGDWNWLEPIATEHRSRRPTHASSWVFSMMVALRSQKLLAFHHLLEQAPLELDGTVEQTAQLVRLELRYGHAERGMNRAYRLFRARLGQVEAAEAYFICLIGAVEPLPLMDDTVPRVGAGTSAVLRDVAGAVFVVTIDPHSVGTLSPYGEFRPADSSDVAALMGAAVGDTVQLAGGMGSARQVVVQSVTTAHRRLLALAQETWTRSLQAPKHLMELSLPASQDGVDFSQMHAMLKKRSAQSERAFAAYRETPLTLGLLGQFLGATAVDLVSAWPSDGPALHVCSGRADEFQAAVTACAREHAQFVVDAATLVELVNLRMAPVLGKLPKVLVTTETLSLLEARLEDARTDRASGRAVDTGGRMSFLESTEARKAQTIRFFEQVLTAVSTHCEVVPTYGPEEIPAEFRRLCDLLPREERAVLLLGAERAGVLLTLDGRLAALASQHLNLVRVWPQALLAHAHGQGWIAAEAYSFASARTFVLKRSFTSMRAVDLLLMCQQGPFMLRRGLEVFKQHLSSPDIDFLSISNVCLEFLERLATQRLSVVAYGEVVSHLCEAIALRPAAEREELMSEVRGLVRELVGNSEAEEVYPPLVALRRQVIRAKLARVEEMIQAGVVFATEGQKHRPIRLDCVMCTPVPSVIFTRQEPEEAATIQPTSQAGSGEPKDQNAATTSRAYLMSPPSDAGATAPQIDRASHTPVQVPHVNVTQTVGPPPSV